MKLPRFTLRDLFWLVLVAAMGCGWCIDRTRQAARASKAEYWQRQTEILANFVANNCPQVRLSQSMEGEVIVTHNPAFPEPMRRPKP